MLRQDAHVRVVLADFPCDGRLRGRGPEVERRALKLLHWIEKGHRMCDEHLKSIQGLCCQQEKKSPRAVSKP